MKKNININLQGIIFHIEEDGYEQLGRYLSSIRNYFSSYEGHEEIVADIEARIAEIFSMRLSPGKQVITLEDVQDLVAQMGEVTDFEILEPMEVEMPHARQAYSTGAPEPGFAEASSGAAAAAAATAARPRRLYRDVSRKVVSGVSAGIANYLNVDPVWIRLIFVFLVIGTPITEGISGSFGLVLYIILWIALPVNYTLPEITVKKLFRDPDDKKLAGVASGIAKYFGVDVAVVRILFLALIFAGGFGILAYIILWVAVPEAASLTERMQMQGNPVTLASIEHTLKENLNMKDQNGEESTAAKVLLLPFRIISQIINWLGRALGPILGVLVTLIRVAAGVTLLVISLGLSVALFTSLFVSLGIVDGDMISMGDFPASVLLEGFPRLGLVAGFFVGLIPILFLILLSIGLLAKRFFMRPLVGWSLFGIWLISLFTMIAFIAAHADNFRRSGEVMNTQSFPVGPYPTITLDGYNTNSSFENRIYFDVQGHTGSDVQVQQRLQAKGKTEAEAQQNARMVTYRVVQTDSVLRFDDSFEFASGAAYRSQRMDVTLMIPQDKQLRLTSNFLRMVPSSAFEEEYSREKTLRNLWQVKGNLLSCITCASDTLEVAESDFAYAAAATMGAGGSVLMDESEYSSNKKTYEFSNFDAITVNGAYHVQVTQGNAYSVTASGDADDLEKLNISQNHGELVVEHKDRTFKFFDKQDPVLIQITVPELRSLDLSGAVKADIGHIKTDNLTLALTGATKAFVDVNVNRLKADITGASKSTFTGRADYLDMDIAGASKLDATRLVANTVEVEAAGACNVDVHATNTLRADAAGASKVRYRGNPDNVITDVAGASKVSRM